MKKLSVLAMFLAMAFGAVADTNDVVVTEAPVQTVEELRAENEALRKENQRLRMELVRRRGGEPVIDLSKATEPKEVVGESENGKAADDGGYWLATKSMRRHNSKCRYYKMGKGRPCKKDEGTPCKKCGG